jgi:hypothetical protein
MEFQSTCPAQAEIELEHTVSENDLVLPPNYPLRLSLVFSKRMSSVIISGGVKKKTVNAGR